MIRVLCLILSASWAFASEPTSADAWSRISQFEFNALADALARRGAPADREHTLVRAVAQLNHQPRSAASTEEAVRLFARLAADNPRDDAGLWSRYFLARAAQLHRIPAEPATAAALYRELVRDHAAHPVGQRALTKLAVLLLYEPAVEPDRAQGFAAAVRLIPQSTDQPTRAELHLLLGRAAVFLRLPPEAALEHLEAAVAAGIATPLLRAAALHALGETARRSDHRELALGSYRRFLAENPRDSRVNLIREHIVSLESKSTP